MASVADILIGQAVALFVMTKHNKVNQTLSRQKESLGHIIHCISGTVERPALSFDCNAENSVEYRVALFRLLIFALNSKLAAGSSALFSD